MCANKEAVSRIRPGECWRTYSKAVGGKTYDGKPLPEYSDLGSQQKGWVAVADLVNKKLCGTL